MAAADLNLSRRALLGAAFAVPVLSLVEGPVLSAVDGSALARHPGLGSLDPGFTFSFSPAAGEGRHEDSFAVTEWDRVLAGFRRAEAAVLALEGGPDEDAFGAAHDRFNAALRRLFALPAPDVAALAVKLEAAVAAELADLAYAPPPLAAFAEDARRLS